MFFYMGIFFLIDLIYKKFNNLTLALPPDVMARVHLNKNQNGEI